MSNLSQVRDSILVSLRNTAGEITRTTNQLIVMAEQNAEDAAVMRTAIIEALDVHNRSKIQAAEMDAAAMKLDDATERELALQAIERFRLATADAMAETLRGRTYQRGHSGAILRDDGVANGVRLDTLTERLADDG